MVTGKPKTALVLVISKQCLILMPLTLLLPPLMGTKGLWLAQPLTDLVIGAAVAVILLKLYKPVRETVSRKESVPL
ncbi:multidrug efflux pump VmrA [compost metagenome]